MDHGASQSRPRKRLKISPLRPLTLRSAPFAKRALAWSADADLAVTGDDSVYVFVPQLYGHKDGGMAGAKGGDGSPSGSLSSETATRAQFATANLHMPVAYPPLDVRINAHLYKAADLPFPFQSIKGISTPSGALPPEALRRRGGSTNIFRQPSGAGTGPLTSVAGTMNSVVSVAWSPVGVGRNRRPVLGVLTANGVVGVYGEALGSGGDGDGDRDGASRGVGDAGGGDMSRWAVLWAVGERMMVPPQRQFGECVVSFAWSKAYDGEQGDSQDNTSGRALLVYATDQAEVVVVSVGSTRRGQGGLAWHVYEVARFEALGPHPPANGASLLDPDFVPSGTAFGLDCSPWVVERRRQEDGDGAPILVRTCLIGYMARNYVGFRRVTVRGPWHTGNAGPDGPLLPDVQLDPQDMDGLCVFLGTDAFMVWEDGVWTHATGQRAVRGVVATPMVAKAFEVSLAEPAGTGAGPANAPHELSACGTAYPDPDDLHTNPIQDVIIYPPDATKPGLQPTHAYIRLSATATNASTDSDDRWRGDWYRQADSGTHADPPTKWPQWTATITRQAHICNVPEGTGGAADDGAEDVDDDLQDIKMENGDNAGDLLPLAAGGGLRLAASRKTDTALQYMHRYRIWGMAQAPGGAPGPRGAVTAVLVTEHAAQHAEASGWNKDRSQVLFGWPASDGPARGPFATEDETTAEEIKDEEAEADDRTGGDEGEDDVVMIDPALEAMSASSFHPTPVSTEARMWSWMYGGGPPIPLVQRQPGDRGTENGEEEQGGPPLSAFQHLVAQQACTICGAAMQRDRGHGPSLPVCRCANGHVFDRCGATGLAIQRPGISRVCGVCGSRTIQADALGEMLRDGANGTKGEATRNLQQAVVGDICGRCGGKFRD